MRNLLYLCLGVFTLSNACFSLYLGIRGEKLEALNGACMVIKEAKLPENVLNDIVLRKGFEKELKDEAGSRSEYSPSAILPDGLSVVWENTSQLKVVFDHEKLQNFCSNKFVLVTGLQRSKTTNHMKFVTDDPDFKDSDFGFSIFGKAYEKSCTVTLLHVPIYISGTLPDRNVIFLFEQAMGIGMNFDVKEGAMMSFSQHDRECRVYLMPPFPPELASFKDGRLVVKPLKVEHKVEILPTNAKVDLPGGNIPAETGKTDAKKTTKDVAKSFSPRDLCVLGAILVVIAYFVGVYFGGSDAPTSDTQYDDPESEGSDESSYKNVVVTPANVERATVDFLVEPSQPIQINDLPTHKKLKVKPTPTQSKFGSSKKANKKLKVKV